MCTLGLTDGEPTFWNSGSYTSLSNVGSTTNYDYFSTPYYSGNGVKSESNYTSTINFVNQRANANPGVSKYSIGISTVNNSGIKSVLKALGPDGTFEASNQQDLVDALDKIRTSISKSIQKAH